MASGRSEKELQGVTMLGHKTDYPTDYAPQVLEAFDNKHPDNDYFVKFNCPEFTSLCPMTGQPDFALMDPKYIEVWGKFTPRGGLSIDPYANYGKPGTEWEKTAKERLHFHDMQPERVAYR
ncbi:MAG: NADPH-dependent 7-cyano-7-deazaguanine reductase [Veillonella sp.]|nr:NADPH-dependent 7-cyano-7-deazaguanine reductase [Veillonella sp.]